MKAFLQGRLEQMHKDPSRDVIGILFTTRMMDSPTPPTFFSDFFTQACAALKPSAGR